MSKKRRPAVTIAIHREGDPESRVYRMPGWMFRAAAIGSAVFVGVVILAAILYTPVARVAARVPSLNRQISRLTEENSQVTQLAATLERLEARYAQVRSVLGAEVATETVLSPSNRFDLPVAMPLSARLPGHATVFVPGASLPVHWPIDSVAHGVVTRGFAPARTAGEQHTGVDIAVPRGTRIRAAGGGRVAQAGFDPEYGLFVLLDHPDGYRTMYGHASRLLVSSGDSVMAGDVIALSGSTGRSTAPHLHYEKRKGDLLIDPRAVLEES